MKMSLRESEPIAAVTFNYFVDSFSPVDAREIITFLQEISAIVSCWEKEIHYKNINIICGFILF